MTEIHIETRFDHPRGCGWREPGGKYLVGGELCRPCGKLPFNFERCPCCGHGIKPTRGWTWIGARTLIGAGHCQGCIEDPERYQCDTIPVANGCVLFEPPGRAGLLWIGGTFYASPESFCREAAKLGISRRIAQIPKDFVVGKTLVLLAHRAVEFAWFQEPGPGIFAAFIPRAIEYVVKGDESPAELERLVKQGCTLVRVERVSDTLGGDDDESARNQPELAGGPGLRPPGLFSSPDSPPGAGGAGAESVPQVPPAPGAGTVAAGDPGPGAARRLAV